MHERVQPCQDPQTELALIREILGVSRANHIMRVLVHQIKDGDIVFGATTEELRALCGELCSRWKDARPSAAVVRTPLQTDIPQVYEHTHNIHYKTFYPPPPPQTQVGRGIGSVTPRYHSWRIRGESATVEGREFARDGKELLKTPLAGVATGFTQGVLWTFRRKRVKTW